jgi:hypothetical protein
LVLGSKIIIDEKNAERANPASTLTCCAAEDGAQMQASITIKAALGAKTQAGYAVR